MKIIITPQELVQRCCWYKYEKYVLKRNQVNDESIKQILEENKEFEIDPKDALIAGLTTSIETNIIQHKFNSYITNYMSLHSISYGKDKESKMYIKVNPLIDSLNLFDKNFPEFWSVPIDYKKSIQKYREYKKSLIESVESKLKKIEIKDKKNVAHKYVETTHVKKVLDFIYE